MSRSSLRTSAHCPRSLGLAIGLALLSLALAPAASASPRRGWPSLTVGPGQTYTVAHTTRLRSLTLDHGASIVAPAGDSLTLTVNGVETGQALPSTYATSTALLPGTYRGYVVLTVTADNTVPWQGLNFLLRQGLYVDAGGVEPGESVFSNVLGGRVGDTRADGITLLSNGQAYDGVYVNNGTYTLNHPNISLDGNGRSDFIGDGAAIVGNGPATRLVVNHARIDNTGTVRTGIVADNGANVIVKDSTIRTSDGPLPAGYTPTIDLGYMMQVPWMLSIGGDVRATNLLGTDTKATYIKSKIISQGWGALSTDSGMDGILSAIDSYVANYGDEGGYGSYAIGNATENFLGDTFDVGTYATINRGGAVHYGDSTPAAVAALNTSLDLGLTRRELARIPDRPTVVHSRRFGFMWHGEGSLAIDGGTIVDSQESTFLDKGQAIQVSVDGSRGVRLNPGNGILMQVMENDDPGPVPSTSVPGRDCGAPPGCLINTGVYTEPTGTPSPAGYDTTEPQSGDAVATFSNIALHGDFYNGIRGNEPGGPFGPGLAGLNMDLTFDNASIDGVISAATTHHLVSPISSANYQDLGEVTNGPSPVINNGVIVALQGRSNWIVPGTSYLSSLSIGSAASVVAPAGKTLTMTVNGTPTAITPGRTYTGNIELTIS
jgi:hypothetical protein